MKTYTCGQIQIVRDALELAQDTSDGEDNRKIRGAIELLDTPLDAFEEVYRLTAERDALEKSIKIRDLAFTYAMTCGFGLKREAEAIAIERDEVREALRIMLLQSPYQDGDGGHRYQACQMAQDALDHVPNVGKMVGQGAGK